MWGHEKVYGKTQFPKRQNPAKNIDDIKKMFQIKVLQNLISYKKLSWRICVSPSGVEQGGSKD